LPDLTHVYLYPLTTVVEFTFLHVPPALTAADAVTTAELPIRAQIDSQSKNFFMSKLYVAAPIMDMNS
jgi:hypothetical protein